ncbi:MAG TPA: hypothetical protein V6C91_04225 [Coleofasciculaceae cyanobacterium]
MSTCLKLSGNEEEVRGADISQLLKADPKTPGIPIILVTAYAMQAEQQKLRATAKADVFLLNRLLNMNHC